MGCDIHAHIEVKLDGVWHHYSCPPLQRSYKVFSRICGVRNGVIGMPYYVQPITEPRGLPDDLSEVTKQIYLFEEQDSHTPSWLSGNELDELIQWVEQSESVNYDSNLYNFQHKQIGYFNGNMFGEIPSPFEETRFICWFDN